MAKQETFGRGSAEWQNRRPSVGVRRGHETCAERRPAPNVGRPARPSFLLAGTKTTAWQAVLLARWVDACRVDATQSKWTAGRMQEGCTTE